MTIRSRVIAIELLASYDLYVDDTTNYKLIELDVPALDGLLPHAEQVWVESLLTNCSTDEIDWNIDAYVGYNRNSELPARPLFSADQSTVGSQKIDAANLTSSYFRRHARLEVKARLHTGVSSSKEGRLSLTLYVKTVGM